jgi:integrase
MRGSVRKRGTTWTWYLDAPPDPLTGKRRQASKGGFRTKREAQQALNEALARLRDGIFVQPSQLTLGSFLLEEWLPAVRPPRVRPSTWESYRMNAETHIVPTLGHLPLQRLTPAQLTAFYRFLLDHGHQGGGGLAAKTVRNIHGELHAALRDAVRWGHVARNVAASADLPKGMAPEMHVWSPEQFRAFLDHARRDRLYAAWLLFATTGMRRGEVAGLRWPDVDALYMVRATCPGGRPPEDQAARRPTQLRHRRPRRRHPGQGRLRAAWARHHRHHDGHLQPCAPRPGRRGRRHGRQAHPGRRRPRAGASR